MFPCPSPSAVSSASDFCATITANGVTATNYPARATLACGLTPERYISACKCGPTCTTPPACTPTPTPAGNLVVNGDFECGLAPWTVQLPDPAATNKIASTANTGNQSFEINFKAPSVKDERGVSARLLTPPISVTPGVTYLLSYATWFDNLQAGFIGANINDVSQTVDATDFGANSWHLNKLAWTAGAGVTTAVIKFEFIYTPSVSAIDRIDTVSLVALASCDDGPWPGLLPNGDFECGIGSWTTQVPDTAVSFAGVKASGGYISLKVFEVDFTAPAISPDPGLLPDIGVSARVFSKPLPVTPGVVYKLSFYAYFSTGSAGFIGVQIGDTHALRVDAAPLFDIFKESSVLWTAPPGYNSASIKFEFLFSETSVLKIDGVVFAPNT
jgi:hypothetical protein